MKRRIAFSTIVVILLLIVIGLTAAMAGSKSPKSGEVPGRYQITTATTEGILYKTDTSTGEVWIIYNESLWALPIASFGEFDPAELEKLVSNFKTYKIVQ